MISPLAPCFFFTGLTRDDACLVLETRQQPACHLINDIDEEVLSQVTRSLSPNDQAYRYHSGRKEHGSNAKLRRFQQIGSEHEFVLEWVEFVLLSEKT